MPQLPFGSWGIVSLCFDKVPVRLPVSLQDRRQGFPDVGHPDQLQPLRRDKAALHPFGDQAFGKAQTADLAQALPRSRKLEANARTAARSAAGSSRDRPLTTLK